jgi:hypothetical protein
LDVENKARIASRAGSSCFANQIKSMTEGVTKAEAKVELLEQQHRSLQKIWVVHPKITSQQIALGTSVHELEKRVD